jgi:hypothetical protein
MWPADADVDAWEPAASPACTVKHLARVDTLRDKLLARSDDVDLSPRFLRISITTTWVPWCDILLFFLRVGLTKIWELGTDSRAIRGGAVLEGHV